jgi:hypothetical protein
VPFTGGAGAVGVATRFIGGLFRRGSLTLLPGARGREPPNAARWGLCATRRTLFEDVREDFRASFAPITLEIVGRSLGL